MRIRDIFHLSIMDIKNRWRTTAKLFVLFLAVVFFASSFMLYIGMLDSATDRLLNEEKENRELILRNREIIMPLDIDKDSIRHEHIKSMEEKYFAIIFENKVAVNIEGKVMTGWCGQLDFTSRKHQLAGEMRGLGQDEVIIGREFARSIGIRDFDSYVGKDMTLIISGHEIFTKKIAGICDGMQPLTVANSAAEEIGKIITVTNWIFVEVDDYSNKEEVKNYLLDTFSGTNVIASIDNEDSLVAINSHRRLMSRIFLSVGIVVFFALVICVVFVMLIDGYNERKFRSTIRAIGMTSGNVLAETFVSIVVIFGIAFAIGYLLSVGVAFAMLGVMESMFGVTFCMTCEVSQMALWSIFAGGIILCGLCTLVSTVVRKNKSIVEGIKEL